MKDQFILIIYLCIMLSLASCVSDKPVPLNPNGDTELAILMRDMYDEGMQMKEDISKGKKLDVYLKHAKILTAEATEPEKAASPEFKSFADHYLFTIEQLRDRKNPAPEKAYDMMVNACLNCHRAMCPGPIVKIKKMVLNESQLVNLKQ